MIALWILGILALLVAAVLLLRLGVQISFGPELHVAVRIGPVRMVLFPKEKEKKKAKKEIPEKKETSEKKKPKEKVKFTFDDVKSAFPILFEALKKALGKIRRRMRVDPLRISVCFGGEDPSKVAQMYGWANTVMWTAMPQLEQLIHIPHPHIHLEVDYNCFATRAEGEVGVSFRVGDLLSIGLTLLVPALKWYLAWKKEKQPTPAKKVKGEEKVKDNS